MPTPASADQAMEAFWREQLKGSATKQLRIQEAVVASLMGANGITASDGTITVDLNRMAAVAAKGFHLDATAEGTTLTVFVVDANGKTVKPDLASGFAEPTVRNPVPDPDGAIRE